MHSHLAKKNSDNQDFPRHVAIIMDGNGRWANGRGMPRVAGHKKGAEATKRTIEACSELGISYLTLYAFSSENWKRPAGEVSELMDLLRFYIGSELKNLHKNGVRLQVIGDRSLLAGDIQEDIAKAESLTKENTKLYLQIALSYGSRQEIVQAALKLSRVLREGVLQENDITEEVFAQFLYTAAIPDPDLLIRTGGEQRVSNFLLWQSAYTELYFSDVLWPDFDRKHLELAIAEFQTRERRYGAF